MARGGGLNNLFNDIGGRMPKPPAPGEVLSPLVGIEGSLMNAVQAPFLRLGLPTPPRVPGPAEVVRQMFSRLPRPPGL